MVGPHAGPSRGTRIASITAVNWVQSWVVSRYADVPAALAVARLSLDKAIARTLNHPDVERLTDRQVLWHVPRNNTDLLLGYPCVQGKTFTMPLVGSLGTPVSHEINTRLDEVQP